MAAFPTTIALQGGFGGSFIEQLVTQAYCVAVWPLHEQATVSDAFAHDITGHHYDGTFVGVSGFTRGVSFALAEGALGMTPDGNGYIEVPDDGEGLLEGFNASLADGDIDVIFLCKNVLNNATNRCVIQKQETNSTGNGWHVSIQNGAVEFYLKVAGVVIFNFQRGAIADAAEHLVHCCYDTVAGTAKIFIDGAQSGATVSGVTTEPDLTTGTLRLFAFANGVAGDGNGAKTTSFCLVMISREGNAAMSPLLQTARAWTTVAAKDLRGVVPIDLRYGIGGSTILDTVARPGTMSFALNNGVTNSARLQGYYTPGHANCRTGFQLGMPIRLAVTFGGVTYYKFRGRLASVVPLPGEYREQHALVTVTGWLDVAANLYLPSLPAQSDIPSHEALKLALDECGGRSPAAVAISDGSSVFSFALDVAGGEQESLLSEITRDVTSERGYLYEKGDTVQGGTVASEGRGDRQVQNTLDATFSSSMHGLEVTYSLDALVNIVKVSFTQRRVDAAATTVLYALEVSQASQPIAPGETVVFERSYRDPDQQAAGVGGTEMQDLVAGTDYAFWSETNGSGSDLSSSLAVNARLGGSQFRVEFTNTSPMHGYLRLDASTAFQIRGKGVYHYSQVTVESRDLNSVRRHGPRTVQIDLAYESDRELAQSIADFYLQMFGASRPTPTSVTLHAWASSALLTQALALEPGHKVGIIEPMTAVVVDDPLSTYDIGYYINGVHLQIEPGRGKVTSTFRLAPSPPAGSFWLLGTAGASELDQSTRLGV